MPDGIVVTQATGLPELLSKLQRVPLVLARRVERAALTDGGEIILEAAQAFAAQHRVTGELAEDVIMEVRVAGNLESGRVSIGPAYDRVALKIRKRGKYAGRPDSSTSPGVYGKFVEEGHAGPGQPNARERKRSGKEIELGSHDVPPHPWLKPAFDSSSEAAVEAIANRTAEGLQGIGDEV